MGIDSRIEFQDRILEELGTLHSRTGSRGSEGEGPSLQKYSLGRLKNWRAEGPAERERESALESFFLKGLFAASALFLLCFNFRINIRSGVGVHGEKA